ncbi:MAG: TldD/PmbA family protein, partial [Clostridia bacterium]|nr:TldD/PmbA family protein [Clostridia bacterium]
MLTQETAAAVLDAALRSGGDFAEIFLEDRRNNVLSMRSDRIETVNSNRLHGAGVRVYSGLSSVYVYTN